ncbi:MULTISPECIES: molybdenum cofactor biosynthesis protein MoaE [unclassified Rothia (in: high G+C Gram-positive bacteria)]|uniref:molybdenum cofactor biosynthesis protein MoaE n=1 Tax=unclassified Rothia (in: high G+C Gram-positive bacteria) TaxID=2689056 RepID=UPI0019566679|nr:MULTISPECIES: molybdenum cofactor biosynthesis protein MoaE [unclassified Rothia (in: high G+C Gram-positive bacteria)]MBM7051857.1 molybdenum cofactor biosynthesis protein MoaE [Rothia sp. ZJ1223]QRZ62059.1 molybdenum cofactor biosynthesis protein MoaE [Rothia sp. ZJ932]
MITNEHLAQYPATEPATSAVVHTDIIEDRLEDYYQQWREAVMIPGMGALVIFDGIVRDHDHGESVAGLSYSAHPLATEKIAEVVAAVVEATPGVRALAVHRVADIPIGESALTVMAAAAHRGLAFDICEKIADDIKAMVPIWKEQTLTDGKVEWVGIESSC